MVTYAFIASRGRSRKSRSRPSGSGSYSSGPEPSIMEKAIIRAPKHTDSRLVFKWQKKLMTYNTSNFNAEKTGNRVTAEEVEKVFESLRSAKHYRATDWTDCIRISGVLILAIFCLFLIALVILLITEWASWTSWTGVLFAISLILIVFGFASCIIMCQPVPEFWYKKRL